jgi:hypothetical protein
MRGLGEVHGPKGSLSLPKFRPKGHLVLAVGIYGDSDADMGMNVVNNQDVLKGRKFSSTSSMALIEPSVSMDLNISFSLVRGSHQ